MVVSVGELLGYILIAKNAINLKRKLCFDYYFKSHFVFGLFFGAFWLFNVREVFLFACLELFICFLMKITIGAGFGLFYTYLSELFPTKIRGTSLGILTLLGRIIASFTVYAAKWENKIKLNPCFLIVVIDLLAIYPF